MSKKSGDTPQISIKTVNSQKSFSNGELVCNVTLSTSLLRNTKGLNRWKNEIGSQKYETMAFTLEQ